jgi:hypothetical protein
MPVKTTTFEVHVLTDRDPSYRLWEASLKTTRQIKASIAEAAGYYKDHFKHVRIYKVTYEEIGNGERKPDAPNVTKLRFFNKEV